MKVWHFSTGALITTLKGYTQEVTSVAISPDNKYIVSGLDDKNIKIWEIQ
ncbi:MAG: WD40 repeat domain-containing protein [Candidatus Odinarchaeota archaeon]